MSVFSPDSVSGPTPPRSSHTPTHAFSRICGSVDIFGLNKRETATLLSIAHLTDWSAELIANKVCKYLGTSISPEKVWDTYKGWEDARNENQLDGPTWGEDIKTTRSMVGILKQYEIKPNIYARPLSQTPRPISVPFSGLWYPKNDDSAILEDFTEKTRRSCFRVLIWRTEDRKLSKPAPKELLIMDKLGHHVAAIIMELLPRWTDEMIKLITKLPFTRAIEESLSNMEIIEKYARLFRYEWEEIFGRMDGTEMLWIYRYVEPPFLHILSTGDAAKMFFRLMLLTRLQSLEERRRNWRDIIGFRGIPLKKLPEDVKNCHICQQPLGVPNDDGEMEMPIQVIACCGNYFGANCLRRWYGEFENTKCPLCKWTASSSFLEKLCYEDKDGGIDVDDLDKESAIARMGSIRFPTPDVDNDLEDGETDIDPYGLGYGEVANDGNDELEDGEIKE